MAKKKVEEQTEAVEEIVEAKTEEYNPMKLYLELCDPPESALTPIAGGKLKGKSDINPQWRIEKLTDVFGPCGIGWKFDVVDSKTVETADHQILLFVRVNFFFKQDGEWSDAIPGYGGDFIVEKTKNGLTPNDEAYKMAVTDALGTAAKMIGLAGTIYRGCKRPDSKYAVRDAIIANDGSGSMTVISEEKKAMISDIQVVGKDFGFDKKGLDAMAAWAFGGRIRKLEDCDMNNLNIIIKQWDAMLTQYEAARAK